MSFEIKKASRTGIIPLIGLFGKSGYGKTFSALLLARGLAGPNGIIRLVDTEKGRGEIFAEDIPGGYDVVRLDEPHTPDRYEEAIVTAANGAACLVVDSMSHAWEGDEGVLEKAEESRDKTGKPGLHCWLHKGVHSRMLRKVCSLPIPVIACLRGKDVYRQTKDGNRSVIVRDENTTPIQDKNFIFEMLVAFEMKKNDAGDAGYVRIEKYTSNRLLPVLPKANERISVEHGKAIADWCAGKVEEKKLVVATAKTREWMLVQLRKNFSDAQLLECAINSGFIMPNETLNDWKLAAVPTTTTGLDVLINDVAKAVGL